MTCYHPITGYHSRKENKNGNRPLEFDVSSGLLPVPIKIACGRCIGCRLDRSRMWALRCVHEAQMHDENSFITLTFSDENLGDGSLHVQDFQRFMKRLRKDISPIQVRFFHCGEYGSKLGRPHHHACLFGYDFPDKVLFKKSSSGNLYVSPQLMKLWPYGHSTVGNVTFDSAAYVARYVLKKWSKDNLQGEELYDAMSSLTDEEQKKKHYGHRHPEYITMSRRGGIGESWYNKFKSDLYPNGFAVVNGKKCGLPKFYDSKFEIDNHIGSVMLKGERQLRNMDNPENTSRRLSIREEVQKLKQKTITRSFEDENSCL